jgi:hypothetical protein
VGVFCNNYESILARLNLSILYSRRRHPDALLKAKLGVLPYLILSVYGYLLG